MRKHIRTVIEILLLCLLIAVGIWQLNTQYQSGYAQGATKGYSDGFTTGIATGQAQQLAALENWLQSVGCETTYSGYIYFKMYQDAGGAWQYTCLVLT